jgi:hypothetical protein
MELAADVEGRVTPCGESRLAQYNVRGVAGALHLVEGCNASKTA